MRRFYTVVQIFRRHEEGAPGRLRARTLKEVLTTETTYVTNLCLAEAEIFGTLRKVAAANPSIIDQKEIDILCQNWVLLMQVHKSFLTKVQEWYSEWPASKTNAGDLLQKLAPKLTNIYKKYVTGFDDSSELLVLLEKKAEFLAEKEKIITVLLQQYNCQLDISAFLIMPVQRLPRYEMLLREIIKHTDENHIEMSALEDAYYKFKELNADVNKWKALEENRKVVLGWQKKIENLPNDVILSAPGRMLLRDGKMKFSDETLQKTSKGHCLLFNDMFMKITKLGKGTYTFGGCARFDSEDYKWSLEFYDRPGATNLQNISDIYLQLKAEKVGSGMKKPDAISNAFLAGLKGLRKDEKGESEREKEEEKAKKEAKKKKTTEENLMTFYFSCGDPNFVTEWAQDIDRAIKTTSLQSVSKQPEVKAHQRRRKGK